MYILCLFHSLLVTVARSRPPGDHPLVVAWSVPGGCHRRGPGLALTYIFKEIQVCTPLCTPLLKMYPMYPKWGTSGVQKVVPPSK